MLPLHNTDVNEKPLRETQTLCAGCSKAEPKIFAPPQTHFPMARDGQNLLSWRWSLPLPTNPVWWGSMLAISSYRGNRPTPPARPLQTHRQDRLQYTAPLSLARSVTRTGPTRTTPQTLSLLFTGCVYQSGSTSKILQSWRFEWCMVLHRRI